MPRRWGWLARVLLVCTLLASCAGPAASPTAAPVATSTTSAVVSEPTDSLIPKAGFKLEGDVPHDYSEMHTQEGVEKNGVMQWIDDDPDLSKDDALWVFGYAEWEFVDGGVCRFTAPLHLRYDMELYPLVGTWNQRDDRVVGFIVSNTHRYADELTVSVTLNGFMEVSNLAVVGFTKVVTHEDTVPRTATMYQAKIRQRLKDRP